MNEARPVVPRNGIGSSDRIKRVQGVGKLLTFPHPTYLQQMSRHGYVLKEEQQCLRVHGRGLTNGREKKLNKSIGKKKSSAAPKLVRGRRMRHFIQATKIPILLVCVWVHSRRRIG
jgi:hypothetical protein